ncbi:nuclear transport factor 2 family protein [Ferrimonas lipolytica]|uniref:Nuclear transport factor 2 family protein n=1 Tax=Ferrimonas lipolytica TaxID=2724191 RepID=A0A6H1UEN8_9GAMM|nr:nuclear transport factor 2 family protein [Ferrimonas lipolytica]QIZ77060.1 nuclear transport factor 2 family protein [Ferrimonas lipolytica]
MSNNNVLAACKQGIAAWQQAFNRQDAAGCAAQYNDRCDMHARPFGTFTGRTAIEAFWQGIIDQGFNDVEYSEVKWQPLGSDGYILSSSWTMNKAFGVVHREHWVVEEDGKARLISDEFEIQGER